MATERPISFSAAMVRAILEGRKTQTRRVISLPRWAEPGEKHTFEMDDVTINGVRYEDWPYAIAKVSGCLAPIPCPYGVPGDKLWVRETFQVRSLSYGEFGPTAFTHYVADGQDLPVPELGSHSAQEAVDEFVKRKLWGGNIPAIHMPRWASRITLEITDVRVERVQDISEEDAEAEGVEPIEWHEDIGGMPYDGTSHYSAYAELWDSINAKRGFGWDKNPWVWVVGFRRLEKQQ